MYEFEKCLHFSSSFTRPCNHVILHLGMYEDAVGLALRLNQLELAKAVAGKPPEDEQALKRKLWLAVARHMVQQGARGTAGVRDSDQPTANIKLAVEFLREAGGLPLRARADTVHLHSPKPFPLRGPCQAGGHPALLPGLCDDRQFQGRHL